MREIADVRVHGTTGEPPLLRFERDEAAALRPIAGRPPFRQSRDLVRKGFDGRNGNGISRAVGGAKRFNNPSTVFRVTE